MTTTLSDMTAKKKPELSAEEIAAKEAPGSGVGVGVAVSLCAGGA